MPPPAAVPKSICGPPARDPPPSWVVSASRRPSQNSSIHFRGFSGEFDFNVPNEEMSAITHRIIQGEQALQMYQCQMQTYKYQMGLLQTQAQIQQFRLMSQRGHVTDTHRSVLPDWAVSEPQNQAESRRRSRSRPPLADDRRRTDRVERLHEDQQELQVRLSSQFRNDLHLWFQPMVYFIILIIPVVPWLKPMWCNKFQQCLRWRPWLAVQAKFIQSLNINIMLVLAYNCGRCLLLWCSVVHYTHFRFAPNWLVHIVWHDTSSQTYTTVSRYQSDSECLWITSDQRTTVLGCESCTLLSPSGLFDAGRIQTSLPGFAWFSYTGHLSWTWHAFYSTWNS